MISCCRRVFFHSMVHQCMRLNVIIQNVMKSKNIFKINLMYTRALMDGQEIENKLWMLSGESNEVNNAVEELQNYSRIRRQDNNSYTMHALIQKMLHHQLVFKGDVSKYVKHLLRIISLFKEMYSSRTSPSWKICGG